MPTVRSHVRRGFPALVFHESCALQPVAILRTPKLEDIGFHGTIPVRHLQAKHTILAPHRRSGGVGRCLRGVRRGRNIGVRSKLHGAV